MPPIVLTPRELADRLDVSYQSVLVWAQRDEIPSFRDGRGRVLFNFDAVVKALRAGVPVEPEPTGVAS